VIHELARTVSRRPPMRTARPCCRIARSPIDRPLAAKIMGWADPPAQPAHADAANTASTTARDSDPPGLRQCLLLHARAHIRHKRPGQDGRLFYGDGMIKTAADLPLLELPDPHDDALYAEAAEFVRHKGDRAAMFVTRMGVFPAMLSMGIEASAWPCTTIPGWSSRSSTATSNGRLLSPSGPAAWASTSSCPRTTSRSRPARSSPLTSGFGWSCPATAASRSESASPGSRTATGRHRVHRRPAELGLAGLHPIENEAMDIRAVKRKYRGACACSERGPQHPGPGLAGGRRAGGARADPGCRAGAAATSSAAATAWRPTCALRTSWHEPRHREASGLSPLIPDIRHTRHGRLR